MENASIRLRRRRTARGMFGRAAAIAYLVALGGFFLVGPYGVLAFGEDTALLEQRQARIAGLEQERAELQNRVRLLDRDNADPDLVTELIRRDLNVAHPDEYVIELGPSQP